MIKQSRAKQRIKNNYNLINIFILIIMLGSDKFYRKLYYDTQR